MQTSPSGKAGADLVEVAAGGLVWRGRGPFRKLAIVHRAAPDRNDWVLPKGKLDRGERPEDAALREVKEEAQVEARLGAPAGCTTHSKNGQPKVTLYWHMRVMRRFEFQPNAEIDQVRWLRPDRAIRLLTHPNERHLVLRECGRGARGSRWCFRGRSPRQDRLETAIAFARTHLNLLAVRAADTAPSAPPASKLISLLGGLLGVDQPPRSGVSRGPDWLAAAHHLLDTAEGALLEGRLDVGWSLIHEVERLRILGLDERDLLARAVSLRHEATEKLSGWRGQAVRRSLEAAGLAGEADEKSMPASCVDLARLRAALFEGQFVLNTHFNNRYHQLGLQGQTLRYLVYILVALVALILFYFNAELPPAAAAPINFTLMLGVMLFGALGGTLSAMFRFSRASTQKIPDAILDGWVTLGRPMIGAASAVFLHLVLSAGVLNLIESTKLTPPLYLAFAFVSGFSESLVLRTAERLGGGDRPGKS